MLYTLRMSICVLDVCIYHKFRTIRGIVHKSQDRHQVKGARGALAIARLTVVVYSSSDNPRHTYPLSP